MDGASRRAGAVAGVTRTRNLISLARAVMEKSLHVCWRARVLTSSRWSRALPRWLDYFRTEERWQELLDWRRDHAAQLIR